MSMVNTVYDFVDRTEYIVDQYEQFVPKGNERFETTLLVNCLAGLLILPQQLKLIRQSDSFSSWGLNTTKIINNTGKGRFKDFEKKSIALQTVIEKMRHCVAHARFYFKDEENKNEITHVVFRDLDEFEVVISTNELKDFVKKLAASAKGKLSDDGNQLLELGRKNEQYRSTNTPKDIKDIADKLSPDGQQLLLDKARILFAEEDAV